MNWLLSLGVTKEASQTQTVSPQLGDRRQSGQWLGYTSQHSFTGHSNLGKTLDIVDVQFSRLYNGDNHMELLVHIIDDKIK